MSRGFGRVYLVHPFGSPEREAALVRAIACERERAMRLTADQVDKHSKRKRAHARKAVMP